MMEEWRLWGWFGCPGIIGAEDLNSFSARTRLPPWILIASSSSSSSLFPLLLFSFPHARWGELYRKARPAMKATGETFTFWAWPKPWRLFCLFIFQNIPHQIIYFIRYQCFFFFFFFFTHNNYYPLFSLFFGYLN